MEAIIYTLEDNKDYMLLDSLSYKNNVYLLLSNIEDTEDICIRKMVNINNELILKRIDDDYDTVYSMFINKNRMFLEK